MNTEIEWVLIPQIKPNPKNRNQHTPEQIGRLATLIRYQGWRWPIVVSKRSGLVVAGHGRLEAAIKNQFSRVPVSYQDFDSEEQEIAFGISDNAIASWATLDFQGINEDIADLGPDFEIEVLGMKDFTVDVAEKDEAPKDEDPYKLEDMIQCPACQFEFKPEGWSKDGRR